MSNPNPSTAIVRSTLDTVTDALTARAPEFDRLLAPYGMQTARFHQIVIDQLRREPSLLKCTPTSLIRACYYSAEIGLELGGPLGDAYIVPFWNNKRKQKEAKCIPGYRGLIHVASEADPRIDHFDAEIVYEADEFAETRGTAPAILHRPKRRVNDRGERVVVYAVVHKMNSDAPPQFAVLDASEVAKVREDSLSKLKEEWQKRDSPWTKNEDEMWKKTAVRRVVKLMNLRTTRARLALDLDAEEHREPRREMKTRAEDLKEKLGGVPAEVQEAEFEDEGSDDGES